MLNRHLRTSASILILCSSALLISCGNKQPQHTPDIVSPRIEDPFKIQIDHPAKDLVGIYHLESDRYLRIDLTEDDSPAKIKVSGSFLFEPATLLHREWILTLGADPKYPDSYVFEGPLDQNTSPQVSYLYLRLGSPNPCTGCTPTRDWVVSSQSNGHATSGLWFLKNPTQTYIGISRWVQSQESTHRSLLDRDRLGNECFLENPSLDQTRNAFLNALTASEHRCVRPNYNRLRWTHEVSDSQIILWIQPRLQQIQNPATLRWIYNTIKLNSNRWLELWEQKIHSDTPQPDLIEELYELISKTEGTKTLLQDLIAQPDLFLKNFRIHNQKEITDALLPFSSQIPALVPEDIQKIVAQIEAGRWNESKLVGYLESCLTLSRIHWHDLLTQKALAQMPITVLWKIRVDQPIVFSSKIKTALSQDLEGLLVQLARTTRLSEALKIRDRAINLRNILSDQSLFDSP
jgi:hypothetical protein